MPDGGQFPVEGARPSVLIEGERQATLTSALAQLEIVESADGLARCDAVFGNWGGPERGGFQHFGRELIDFGKALKIALGNDALFEGRIGAINARYPDGGTAQVGLCAQDRLQDLRMTRRTRCFADASLADVARQLARDHGLQPRVDVSGPVHKTLAQLNQSDLAFLRDLARREDAQVWVEGSVLHVAQHSRRLGATVELSWAGALREFEVCADLAQQKTKLVGAGWNVATKSAAQHGADEAAIRAELGGGISGAASLQRAFGARADTLAHQAPANDAQARALAEASFRHLARRFVSGRGVATTQAGLRVGARLRLRGLGPLFEGEYTVTEVRVRFDKGGLRTEFACDRPFIGQA